MERKLSSSRHAMWKLVLLAAALQFMVLAHGELHHGGPGGRFLVESSDASGRRVLHGNGCGRGAWPNFSCRAILRRARQPRCCVLGSGRFRFRSCRDVGGRDDFHCGACNNRCGFRRDCCSGRCVDTNRDRNNCGRCGNRCRRNQPCRRGQCRYNGRGND